MLDAADAACVRVLLRFGWNSLEIASWFNRLDLLDANGGLAWRECDVWNLLARAEREERIGTGTWPDGDLESMAGPLSRRRRRSQARK